MTARDWVVAAVGLVVFFGILSVAYAFLKVMIP